MGKGLKEAALLMLEHSDFETVIDWVIKENKSALKDDLTAANARLFAEFKELKPHQYIDREGNVYKDLDPYGIDMSGKRSIRALSKDELLKQSK